MERVNILNPNIWKELNNIMIDNIDVFTKCMIRENDASLFRILRCYNMYLKNFSREDNEHPTKQLIFNEKEINSFIRKEHLLTICKSINKSFTA
jgi:hypothetical protein